MAKVNPVDVEKFLKGLDYPATKEDIISHARAQGADENMIEALNEISDREYEGPAGISHEMEKAGGEEEETEE